MKSKIWVELIICNFDMPPDAVTDIAGVKPTVITEKGNVLMTPKGKKIVEPFNEWILESGCATSQYLEEQIKILISKLKPFRKEFLDFCKKYPPDFNIIIKVYIKEPYPYIGIDNREIIKDMAELNATFGIDYSFFENEEDI